MIKGLEFDTVNLVEFDQVKVTETSNLKSD